MQLSRIHFGHLLHFVGDVLTETNSLNCHFQERGVNFSSIRYAVCYSFCHLAFLCIIFFHRLFGVYGAVFNACATVCMSQCLHRCRTALAGCSLCWPKTESSWRTWRQGWQTPQRHTRYKHRVERVPQLHYSLCLLACCCVLFATLTFILFPGS